MTENLGMNELSYLGWSAFKGSLIITKCSLISLLSSLEIKKEIE